MGAHVLVFDILGALEESYCFCLFSSYLICIMPLSDLPIHESIRVLLLNPQKEILLMRADDPSTRTMQGEYRGSFWFTIGGKIEVGEDVESAVIREIYEETGLKASEIILGPIVWHGEFDLILSGVPHRLKQRFIVAHTNEINVTIENFTVAEKAVVQELRWFGLDDIKNCQEHIYPAKLAEYLPAILAGHYPRSIIEINLE